MTMYIILVFIIGLMIGSIFGSWHRGRSQATSVFEEGSDEADELRAEGAKAVNERIEKRKRKIVNVTETDGRITNDGVEDLFCISDRTAGRYLGELVKEGKLEKVGTSGRGVYYILPKGGEV